MLDSNSPKSPRVNGSVPHHTTSLLYLHSREQPFIRSSYQFTTINRTPIHRHIDPGDGYEWATYTCPDRRRDYPVRGFMETVEVRDNVDHERWIKAVLICWNSVCQSYGARIVGKWGGREDNRVVWVTRAHIRCRERDESKDAPFIPVWPHSPDEPFSYKALLTAFGMPEDQVRPTRTSPSDHMLIVTILQDDETGNDGSNAHESTGHTTVTGQRSGPLV